MKVSGADALWSCLCEHAVDTVFDYPGGAILPAYDRLLDHPIRHVLVRHERRDAHGRRLRPRQRGGHCGSPIGAGRDGSRPAVIAELLRPWTVVVRYAHAIDSLDRVASVPRRQRVRVDAFTAVAAPDGATAQATIMFESTDKTAARVVALLGRQVGVLAVEEWTDDDSRR